MTPEFLNLLERVVEQAAFDFSRRHDSVDASTLRRFYNEAHARPMPFFSLPAYWFEWSRVEIPAPLDGTFMNSVAELLKDYVHEDRVGFLPGAALGPMDQPSVAEVAERIVRAAALFGLAETTNMLGSWASGNPMHFTQVNVLGGLSIPSTLVMQEGLWLEKLPTEREVLFRKLPVGVVERTFGDPNTDDLPGATVLCHDFTVAPVFYHPESPPSNLKAFPDVAVSSVPFEEWEAVPTALSLACDRCVYRTYGWRTMDPVTRVLVGGNEGHSRIYDTPSISSTALPVTQQEDVDRAHDLIPKIIRDKHLDVAIARWIKGKSSRSLDDHFIELRIVAEALYGVDPNWRGEFSFRVATHGAWHLGKTLEKRLVYFDTFRKLYDAASSVVHGGRIGKEKDNLAKEASWACRDGILKILDEGAPKWERLRLGE